ncbi:MULTISPECIES: substrate-binding domain-containing protein [Rhodobacterales]|uniref:substrate-binding domain-containing protein n=1 Tax=Roseobacter sp. N2S TaxID=2663844 RepID=UPI002861FCE8|nr:MULTISPECIES: substrate-binding domain-containing protein [Rhodobacterales]MDR6265732.1 ABC-type branched-subunit amino acid transport system substrate-binding protein [Roseobacter sp. N2S]
MIPMCGSAGLWAPSCIACAQVAVDELNKGEGIAGRPIQLIMVDTAIETNAPVEDLINSLIETGSIDAIVGMHISAMRQRLSKVVQGRVPYIYTPLYEGGEHGKGIFTIGETPSQQLGPAIEHLQSVYRPKKWALIGNDYVWPRTSHAYAKSKVAALGASLSYERYLPFGQADFYQEIEDIVAAGSEAVLISLVGQDAVQFNRNFGELDAHTHMIRLSCAIEENSLLASGEKALKRLFSSSSYFAALSTERNAAFKEKYHTLHGERAPMLNALGQSTYEGVQFLAGLLSRSTEGWNQPDFAAQGPLPYKSVRSSNFVSNDRKSLSIYLARADGMLFHVEKKLFKSID